jgi:hypothetical protein
MTVLGVGLEDENKKESHEHSNNHPNIRQLKQKEGAMKEGGQRRRLNRIHLTLTPPRSIG